MISIDEKVVSKLIKECAETYIKPRFKALSDTEIHTKTSANDLVTVADIEAEAFLENNLPDLLPDSLVVGEESVSRKDVSTSLIETSESPIWVIDPVDGTYNFAHGINRFGLMLALVHRGISVHGWIYDIPQDRMFYAAQGQGARVDGQVLSIDTSEKPLDDVEGFAGMISMPDHMKQNIKDFRAKLKSVESYRCSAYEYMALAEGKRDFSIYRMIQPWDHMAGTLIVKEAGGVSKYWDGGDYIYEKTTKGLITARNDNLYKTIQNVLNG